MSDINWTQRCLADDLSRDVPAAPAAWQIGIDAIGQRDIFDRHAGAQRLLDQRLLEEMGNPASTPTSCTCASSRPRQSAASALAPTPLLDHCDAWLQLFMRFAMTGKVPQTKRVAVPS